MARAPDQKYLNPNPGPHKGDQHAGGSEGGKHGRPQDGWEKGDVARDFHPDEVDARPRRKPSR